MELVVGMLLVSVAGYTLAAYHRNSPAALEAGMKYFLIGALTNSLLLLGVVLLYGVTGTTSYEVSIAPLTSGADTIAVAAKANIPNFIIRIALLLSDAPKNKNHYKFPDSTR